MLSLFWISLTEFAASIKFKLVLHSFYTSVHLIAKYNPPEYLCLHKDQYVMTGDVNLRLCHLYCTPVSGQQRLTRLCFCLKGACFCYS